jgi:hypothetical protein
MALRREVSRETFLEAALLCMTFFWAERMRIGWAAANAALAASLSPEAIDVGLHLGRSGLVNGRAAHGLARSLRGRFGVGHFC